MARNGRPSGSVISTLLLELGAEVSAEAKKALLVGAETILADAKSRIHDISGELAASGKLQVTKNGNMVKISFGATSDDGYMYAKIVEFRPGHEHPFLYPAYDAHRNQIKENITDAIREAVRSRAVP